MKKENRAYLESIINMGLFTHAVPVKGHASSSEIAVNIILSNVKSSDRVAASKNIASICIDIYKAATAEHIKQNILHVLKNMNGISDLVYKELWVSFYDEKDLTTANCIIECAKKWKNISYFNILEHYAICDLISSEEIERVKEEIVEAIRNS